MKKNTLFRAGAVAYMVLGATHLFFHLFEDGLGNQMLQTFVNMRETTYEFLGKNDLMQFFVGFSATMGVMLFAFGLQALLIKRPSKQIIILNILVSGIVLILSILYFTPLSYVLISFSLICFMLSYLQGVIWPKG